jgi:glycolate oxidase
VRTDAASLAAFGSDALTAFHQRPAAVVLAETADEVEAVVRVCHRLEVPFVARGSGTSLSGGSLPIAGGVVIALNRMNRVLSVDPDTRTAVVEPGVINLDVTKAALPTASPTRPTRRASPSAPSAATSRSTRAGRTA